MTPSPPWRTRGEATFVLGIETSCDETAAAAVEWTADGAGGMVRVLSSVVASQDDLHAEFRGVVPEIASRAHAERALPVVRRALAEARLGLERLDAVAVGHRPGLIGALLVGVAAAKGLAWARGVPLVGVDHVRAHLFGACLDGPLPMFPALGLVVSGGHTSLFRCDSPTAMVRLGGTIDDAAGEAFDKVATILDLGFPGGPAVDRLAGAPGANDRAVEFPISRLGRDSLDFSFSGLKTAVLYAVRGVPGGGPSPPLDDARKADIAASFQRAVCRAILMKLERAMTAGGVAYRTLIVGGGVSANSRLRTEVAAFADRHALALRLPAMRYCVDNAAMIAGLACHVLPGRGWASDVLALTATPTAVD